jgi:hypothetical protein
MSADTLSTCRRIDAEFDRRFDVSAPEVSADARKHLASCARCRSLYRWIAEQPAVTGVSSELSRRIRSQLAASLTPVKPAVSIGVCVLRFLAIFLAFAAGLVVTMGAAGLGRMSTGQFLGSGLLLAAGAILFSLSLARQMAPGSRRGIATWVAMALFGSTALCGITLLFPWREPGASIGLSWQCSLREVAIATPAAALLWLLLRRSAPALSPTALGASVGAMAGLLAVTVLQFGCVYQQALHLLLWHWSVLAIAAGAGALLGRLSGRFSVMAHGVERSKVS